MSTLSVVEVPSEEIAEQVINTLKQLQAQNLIQIEDAAIALKQANGKPKIRQLNNMAGKGALGGAFWGLLFGLLFFVPFLGAAIGAGAGALAGKLSDYGIDNNFIKQVSGEIESGQVALFLLTRNAVVDKLLDALKQYPCKLIQTSLPQAEEAQLREAINAQVAK